MPPGCLVLPFRRQTLYYTFVMDGDVSIAFVVSLSSSRTHSVYNIATTPVVTITERPKKTNNDGSGGGGGGDDDRRSRLPRLWKGGAEVAQRRSESNGSYSGHSHTMIYLLCSNSIQPFTIDPVFPVLLDRIIQLLNTVVLQCVFIRVSLLFLTVVML